MLLLQQMVFAILAIIRERQISHDSLNTRNEWYGKYDFIVVGGGTAGSVVASRLSEIPDKMVLLIEAGQQQSVRSDIPALEYELTATPLDWNYTIVPQKYAFQGFVGNRDNSSRGKAFGGCSIHNSMNYYRENPEYYDYWTELTGVPNWNYSHVLPYFLKSENNTDQNLIEKDPTVHRTGGPLTIITQEPDPILKAYLNASVEMGYPITHPDGRQPFGSTIMQTNIKDGVRQSASLVFLERGHRKNLHILGQTLVTKILFNEKNRAIGVQFFRNYQYSYAFARSEVIICAGSPGSPHLLMLSGVGPKHHLHSHNIPVISDRNVGIFQYVMAISLNYDIKDQLLVEKPIKTLENFYKYFVKKGGPLAYKASGTTHFKEVPFRGRPQLSNGLFLVRISYLGTDLEKLVKNYKLKEEWRQYYRPYLNRTAFQVLSIIARPQGSGTFRLASKDPHQYPIIEPCYFCNEQDLNDLVKTVKLTLKISESPVMSKVIEIFKNPIPGCSPCADHKFCDSYIRCILQTNTVYVYPTGGCRIGLANDYEAVVDQRLKVFGVSSLRVIDSSIIPVNSDQTNAIAIMIGEYGADMIKEDYGIAIKTNKHADGLN